MTPTLAMPNLLEDPLDLGRLAREHAFGGVDWSFEMDRLPNTPREQRKWVEAQAVLSPLEVRYHCPFPRLDLGHDDPRKAAEAAAVFRGIVKLVARAGGRFLSIHVGLGRDSTEPLNWEATVSNLRGLVQFGAQNRVTVCLENLAWGWTSRPNLFEKLIRLSGAGVTLDLGHAQVSETVRTQQFAVEDFVTPHPDRVYNAHVYDREVPGLGHLAPASADDMSDRLELLLEIGCPWWLIEIKEPGELVRTRDMVAQWLQERSEASRGETRGSP